MSRPHESENETPRDATSATETPRPAGGPTPSAVAPNSALVTDVRAGDIPVGDARAGDPRDADARPTDSRPAAVHVGDTRRVGALPTDSRPAAVRVTDDGITEVGFDDPELRPLPHDKLHYHVPHPDPHPELHEHSDVPIRPLAITLAAIAATCVLTGVLLYWLFWNFKGQQEASERPRTGVPMAKPVVPEPRLQGVPGFSDNHPTQDMTQMRARYAAELERYAPNPGTSTARIPIERAIELALERNLFPVGTTPGGAPASRPSTGPSTRPAPQGGTR